MKTLLLVLLTLCGSFTAAQTATFSDVYTFTGAADGQAPFGQLVLAGDGALYGMNTSAGIFKLSSSGALTVPLPLTSMFRNPRPVISGPDGALYIAFDLYSTSSDYCGLVYRLDLSGNVTTFYQLPCTSNSSISPLALGPDNSFYGFAYYGDYSQYGALFQLSSSGVFTILHAYTANDAGEGGDLTFASNGTLYAVNDQGCGAIYQFDPSWNPTLVHAFTCGSDGLNPSDLIEASDGILYGISSTGYDSFLFSVSLDGNFNVVGESPTNNKFDGNQESSYSPAMDAMGNLYGQGNFADGDFFQVSQSAQFDYLYTVNPDTGNGNELDGSMTQGTDGAFYGVAGGDEINPYGTIYRLAVSTATVPPVQLSFSESDVSVGDNTTLSWSVSNAFSVSMQQCYALVQNNATGAGSWTGLQTGAVSNGAYVGSATITPTEPGFYTYALTCGGFESGFASLTVGSKATTSLNLTATSPVMLGSYAMLTANVSTTENVGTITGSVTFSSGGLVLGTVNLSGGSASLNAEAVGIPTGTYPITATYSGDANYQGSSAKADVVVLGYATSVSISTSASTVTQGRPLALSASVSRTGVAGTPTGSVTFYYGSSALGRTVVKNGIASLSIPSVGNVPVGTYAVKAVYSGDSTDQTATSPAINITVIAATAISLAASPNPVPPDHTVMLTAEVKEIYAGTIPTGTVTFSVGSYVIGMENLDGTGTAVLNASDAGFAAGKYPVTAAYSGYANNAPSNATIMVTLQ